MTRAADAIDAAPRCAPADAPALTRYDDVREGARFSLRVRREPSGAWAAVEPLAMPMHHASSLQFEPPIDALVAEPDRGRIITVIAVGAGRRRLEFDARRRTWFATYVARVERACAVMDEDASIR